MPNYHPPRAGAIALTAAQVWEVSKRLPATVAALTCTGVGIFYNAEFARQFGEAAIALAVASDVLKALSGPTLMAAIRARDYGRATAAFMVLVVTLTVSLVAAFGSATHVRETATDGRAELIRAFDDADKRAKALNAELAILGTPRPVDVIQAEVAGYQIDMTVWRRSKQCADISRADTKTACEPILALYRERGAAARKLEIDHELAELRPALAKGRPANADPQAAAISAVTGLDQEQVRRLISALIVLAIEVGAIGGSIMAAKPMLGSQPPIPANDAVPGIAGNGIPGNSPAMPRAPMPPKTGQRGRKSDPAILDFSEAFSRKNGRSPTGSDIKAEFPELPVSTAYDYASRARRFQTQSAA